MIDAKPNINITPLIDVLLVLLIIFMIITPLKPSDFKTKIPQEPKQEDKTEINIHTLVVAIDSDHSLKLNQTSQLGTVENPEELIKTLSETFQKRKENGVYDETNEKILKTVFIKAPLKLPYGDVVKVVDAVKIAGAEPISLQIDDLE